MWNRLDVGMKIARDHKKTYDLDRGLIWDWKWQNAVVRLIEKFGYEKDFWC